MSNLVFDESSSHRESSRGYAWWFSGETFENEASSDRKRHTMKLSMHLFAHPGRLTLLYFGILVLIVTITLMLPISAHGNAATPLVTAFFTAVSALSTCGIPVVNTTTHWSMFGQAVILLAIQFGGIGVMTFASMIALVVNRHITASQRLLTANELGTNKLSEVKGVMTVVVTTAFVIESITFLALFPGLWSVNNGSWSTSAWESLFYAVASYNNAGFTPDGAGLHVNSWAVGLPIMLSAFCGTLGFPVLLNLYQAVRHRTPVRKWRLHTKITLVMSFVLVLTSLVWFLLVEWDNPFLFKNATTNTRLQHALAAAVMPRTSGFDISWVPQVSEPTKVFMSALMFIGGGSTSTAGGIRVTTFAVVLLISRAAFTGHRDVTIFHKRIPTRIRMTAVSITTACFMFVFTSTLALMMVSGASLTDALFDTCSAFGLGGYTVGVASADNPAALLLLAVTMIFGRLGPMTIAYAINRPLAEESVRYPCETVVVG